MSMDELQVALKQVTNKKASETDGFNAKFLTYGGLSLQLRYLILTR